VELARKFRLTAPVVPESDIHQACADALDKLLLPPAVWACYPAGATQLTAQQVARYSRLGLKRGWPDLIIIFDGRIFGLEVKRKGGRLSKTRVSRTRRGSPRILDGQEDVFKRLAAAGMTIAVAHSVDEMLNLLRDWGMPVRC
jgi:hypothetical protein